MQDIKLNGTVFYRMLRRGLEVLEENRAAVDALNVFPVPDGDTGTNMVLTMRSAVKEMEKSGSDSLSELVAAVSLGSLMGARGNSGVILSQLLRGMAKNLGGKEEASGLELAQALQLGVKTAYKAVMKPVEGTILTVSREAAEGALRAAKKKATLKEILDAALICGEESLVHTPDLLSVLKKAGVVDAGGKGFILILRGAREALGFLEEGLLDSETTEPDRSKSLPPTDSQSVALSLPDTASGITPKTGEIPYLYCTEVMVRGSNLPLNTLRKEMVDMGDGDSLLVVGTEQVAKVHVHTNHPGRVMEICLKFGTLHQVKVDNMQEQHREMVELGLVTDPSAKETNNPQKNEANDVNAVTEPLLPAVLVEPVAKKIGLVAVAMGSGIAKILRSLGVDQIVEGGQTMNPSIEELVQAVNRIPVSQVMILPNNSNIILAAEQAAAIIEKEVRVVPTRSLAQAIGALVAFDPDQSLEENFQAMLNGSKQVKSGEVTFAVRDSQIGEMEIKANQVIGLAEGEIKVVGDEPAAVVKDLLAQIVDEDDELISLFYGQEVESEQVEKLEEELKERFPDCEVECHPGGQSLYYYLISVE